MRYILTLLILLSITYGQDTLITDLGVKYLGKFVEQTETHVFFQVEGLPHPQPLSVNKVSRVGMYDGTSLPAPTMNRENIDEMSMGAPSFPAPPPTATSTKIAAMGIKGGLSMAKFIGDDANFNNQDDYKPEYITSYMVGAFLTLKMSDKFAIQPEILYVNKGNRYETSYEESYGEDFEKMEMIMKYNMQWIEVPILGIYSLNKKISVFAGPYVESFLGGKVHFDYSVSASYNGETYSESDTETEDFDKEDIRNIGYGIILGAGYSVTPKIGIEARYSMGLSTLDEEPEDWDDSDEDYEVIDIRNSGIQLLVAYSF